MQTHSFEEHTADVRIRLEASSLPELFEEAGRALAELMLDPELPRGSPGDAEAVELRSSDREALLVDWLNELIFRAETRKRIYTGLRVDRLSDEALAATIRGVPVEALRTAVKAATFHQLRLSAHEGGFSADVVLDI